MFLFKLIPGSDGSILKKILPDYDALIIESFGVGGIPAYVQDASPDNTDNSIANALKEWRNAGKTVIMATQVTHEGSDMAVYQVGQVIKDIYDLP